MNTPDVKTGPRADGETPAIEMRDITKSFGANNVLQGVDFELRVGEVHALVGGNGAGKSTLMKILQGVYERDSGSISIGGQPATYDSIHGARDMGIGMVFQEFSLIPTLTVAENIFLGREHMNRFGLIDDAESVKRSAEIFEWMDVSVDPSAIVGRLPTAYWQLTEIAKAVAQEAKVLILDEPTASLAQTEVDALFTLVRRLASEGLSMIYISHRMDEIFEIADRITVLRDGSTVLTTSVDTVDHDDVIHAIVGRKVEGQLVWKPRTVDRSGEPLLRADHLSAPPRVNDISFDVFRGEIVGLAGLMGSGRTELARCLFGIDPLEEGSVTVEGRAVTLDGPRAAIRSGMALVPEDRRSQGLILKHTVEHNATLTQLGELRNGPFLSSVAERRRADKIIDEMDVKTSSPSLVVSQLSGGNQQKIVIGKWLATGPDLLILDEPTAGIDIGTKSEIIDRIRLLADAGTAVIVISSELPELLAVADRILILKDGSLLADVDRADIADEHALNLAVQGVTA